MCVKEMDVLTRQWFVKWWDKFFHTQDVIDNVTREFPAINTITHDKAQAPPYPLVQIAMPQPTTTTPATTSTTKLAKPSTKTKKKKSAFDGPSKFALIALLKQQWKDEEEAANANEEEEEDGQELGASSKASVANTNPYYPYKQEVFGHDEVSKPDLGEN